MAINTKIKVLYLNIGSTASAHKWNFVDSRDLDAAYRAVFSGGWTHDETGATPNGTTGYADTFFIPSAGLADANHIGLSVYSATDQFENRYDIGAYDGTYLNCLTIGYGAGLFYPQINDAASTQPFVAVSNTKGYFSGNRTDGNTRGNKTGIELLSTTIPNGLVGYKVYVGALNNAGTASNFANKKYLAASVNTGLTALEDAAMFQRLQEFNIKLRRAVGNHGTVQADSYYDANVPAVLLDNRFSVYGIGSSSSYIQLANSFTWNVGESISLFVRINSYGSLASLFSNKNTNHNSLVALSDSGHLQIQTDSAEGATFNADTSGGDWNNIIISRVSSSECRVYVNNVESSSGPLSIGGGVFTIDALMTYFTSIGGSATYTMNGWMAEFRKFDNILSAADRARIVAGDHPQVKSSIYLKLNEGSGTTAYDYVYKISAPDTVSTATQSGKGRITAATNQPQTGKSRITVSTSRNQTGITRIRATMQQAQTGKGRVTASALQTNTGKSRIQKVVTGLQTGTARLQKTVLQLQTGKAQIRVTTQQAQTGKANILPSNINVTQPGKSRIQKVIQQLQTGTTRIQKSVSQGQTGTSRIQKVVLQLQTGKSRITANVLQTQTGKSRIQKVVSQLQTGTARIRVTVSQNQSGKALIGAFVSVNQTGKARIQKSVPVTNTGKARITKSVNAAQTGKSRIQKVVLQLQTGTARIRVSGSQTTTGKASIRNTSAQTQAGKARIIGQAAVTQTGKANIRATNNRVQSGTARIRKIILKLQFGTAQIRNTTVRDQQGKSRIQRVITEIIAGKALITATVQQNQTGKARIKRQSDQLQTGKSRIQVVVSSNQGGTGRIKVTNAVTQAGRASIIQLTNVHIYGLSRIINNIETVYLDSTITKVVIFTSEITTEAELDSTITKEIELASRTIDI